MSSHLPHVPDNPGPGTPGSPGTPDASARSHDSHFQQQLPSKIKHIRPMGSSSVGGGSGGAQMHDANRPLPVAESSGPLGGGMGKITAFGKDKRHEDSWTRTPNTTGAGAIHVKTFHCKLTDDALSYMDQAINEWLDAHPQYEVKFVSSTIGTLTGKMKEPALFCQIWV